MVFDMMCYRSMSDIVLEVIISQSANDDNPIWRLTNDARIERAQRIWLDLWLRIYP